MLDINPHCEKYLRENLKKHPHLNLREFICGSAENIHQVQSGSVDVVVSSRTLCSLDESKALKEIFRVLKHNGKLVFEEHIISSSRTWRIIQQFLSISKISKTLCFGCRLNKEIISAISQAGFHKVQHKRIDQSFSLAGQLQPYVVGTATKP
ncbi:N6-adenosine-methyltransferase TMT1A-like [Neocloeon triangulifer]|uniref:N6-adenosine-methyltransferase TMT1A-like n=1 Tax=Neocloeon triangulifer TaxID=2078957 RepID=UPI00286F31EC|nr:N6-adenosine-methyltransferase TMT1A-like [Neocloeon triangulifer]